MVRKLEYWGRFDEDDRAALLDLPHQVRPVEQHHYIVRERDVSKHSCLMLSGYSVRHKIVRGGLRQIVSIHMKGELVDLQNSLLGVADHSVQMLTRGNVAFIPRDAIRKIAFDRPAIGMAMWFDTLVDASIFREWLANVGPLFRGYFPLPNSPGTPATALPSASIWLNSDGVCVVTLVPFAVPLIVPLTSRPLNSA